MNKIMAAGGILALLFGLVILVLPVSRIPLLDANRTILAETERDAYCAGLIYGETRSAGNGRLTAECRSHSDLNDEINWNIVQPAFCRAIKVSMDVDYNFCLSLMEDRAWWPTKDGQLADSWNRRFPYPGNRLTVGESTDSRTGDRDGIERGDITR